MLVKTTKTLLLYGLILLIGLAAGRYVPQIIRMMTPKYSEGNFDAYYPDARIRVVVYGTETCPYCIKTRAYFKERHIAFTDIDIAKSEKGKHDYAQLGGKGVPLILIGNRQMTGFDRAEIDRAIDKAKPASL